MGFPDGRVREVVMRMVQQGVQKLDINSVIDRLSAQQAPPPPPPQSYGAYPQPPSGYYGGGY